MAEPSDFSSDLQRLFFHASQLASSEDVHDYLDRECGDSSQDKQLILRMLETRGQPEPGPLADVARFGVGVGNFVAKLAHSQTFLDEVECEFPSIARYDIRELLGEGAMGRVFLAEQREPIRRSVALKVIKPGMDSAQVLARFEAEKQTLAMLDHPNICQVYDAGSTDRGYPYFSMELVKGNTIDEYCRSNQLSIDDRIRLIITTCKATHYAHLQGIIHRDLKPSNVLVKDVDGGPVIKVIDFGVAKALTTDPNQSQYETYFKQLIGTPLYMCPEQVMTGRKQIDARCDVYSLGGLLYKLVTGYEPIHRFDSTVQNRETLQQLILDYAPPLASRKIAEAEYDSPETLVHRLGINPREVERWRRQVRGDLENVLSKTLEKNPDARYQSALELADDLQRVVDRVPVVAKRRFRMPKFASQSGRQLITAMLVVILLTAVIYFSPKRPSDSLSQVQSAAKDSAVVGNGGLSSEALDYIEVSRLQSMFKALAEHDLQTLGTIQLPRTVSGNLLGEEENSDGNSGPSLRRLIERLGKPTPLLEMSEVSAIHDFSVSPDNRYVVAGYEDGHARIWNLEDGRMLGELPEHAKAVTAVAFSGDGKVLLTGDQEGILNIWDSSALAHSLPYDGADLPLIYEGNAQDTGIESFAFSPDNRLIAVGHRYGPVIIRDLKGGELSRIHLGEPNARNNSVLFSKDGQQVIFSNAKESRIEWWDYREHRLVNFTTLEDDHIVISGYPREILISPEIACFSSHQSPFVYSFDEKTGSYLSTFTVGASGISSLQLLPEDNLLLTAHENGAVCVTKLEGEPSNGVVDKTQSWTFGCHTDGVAPAAVKALALDRDRILTAGKDGRLCLWSLKSLLPTLQFDAADSMYFYISSSGTAYGFEYDESSALVRRFESPTTNFHQAKDLSQPIRFPAQTVKFQKPLSVNDSSQVLATLSASGIDIFDVATGAKKAFIPLDDELPYQLDWAADGKTLVGLASNHVYAWKAEDEGSTFVLISKFPFDAPLTDRLAGKIKCVASGKQAAITYDRVFSLVDLIDQKVIHKHSKDSISSISISENRDYWAMSTDVGIEVYKIGSSVPVLQSSGTGAMHLQFCDNDRILIGLAGGLRAWHIPTGTYIGDVPFKEVTYQHLTDDSILVTTTGPNGSKHGAKVTFFGYPPY